MTARRILVMDADADTASLIASTLEHDGVRVRTVPDCATATEAVREFQPQLVINNATSCGADGIDLSRTLQESTAPILVLTLRDVLHNREAIRDRVQALLCRPEANKADGPVVERLETPAPDLDSRTSPVVPTFYTRRAAHVSESTLSGSIANPALALDHAILDIYANGHPANLTPTEFGVMSRLVAANGSIVSYQTLLDHVWGAAYHDARHLLQVHMQRLRLKLENAGAPRDIIRNRWGVGYALDPAVVEATRASAPTPKRQLAG